MKQKRASRGVWAGQDFWSCARYPRCKGKINIGGDVPEPKDAVVHSDTRVAAYAQQRFERERKKREARIRAALMPIAAISVVGMTALFFGFLVLGVAVASAAAVAMGLGILVVIGQALEAPISWGQGAAGERKTVSYLHPLIGRGFVILNNRHPAGSRADIDHLVIGPTGVFVIETKNWNGRASSHFDRLTVGRRDRTAAITQVKREAAAVQFALAGGPNCAPTVTPALCLIGGRTLLSQKRLDGVQLSDGKDLVRFLVDRPVVLNHDQVQELARTASRELKPPTLGL